jgi:uncharacterized OB-fold protein
MTSERKYPAPIQSPENRPFWDAAAQGRFMIRRCKSCKEPHWYPRALCPFCQGDTEWQACSGEGAIHTYTIMRRSPEGPFALGYVTLDEGPCVYTNFVDCDFDKLAIGARVKVVFKASESSVALPFFTLA